VPFQRPVMPSAATTLRTTASAPPCAELDCSRVLMSSIGLVISVAMPPLSEPARIFLASVGSASAPTAVFSGPYMPRRRPGSRTGVSSKSPQRAAGHWPQRRLDKAHPDRPLLCLQQSQEQKQYAARAHTRTLSSRPSSEANTNTETRTAVEDAARDSSADAAHERRKALSLDHHDAGAHLQAHARGAFRSVAACASSSAQPRAYARQRISWSARQRTRFGAARWPFAASSSR